MKKSIYESEFINEFDNYNRSENFSRAGRKALFGYLQDLEESTGSEVELDIIALCGEYSEYENFEALQSDYTGIESMEELEDQTTVIMTNDEAFIIQNF